MDEPNVEMTDDGRHVMQADEWAIVWSPDQGYRLVCPDMPGDAEVPGPALAITTILLRLQSDPEFVTDCAEWFKNNSRA